MRFAVKPLSFLIDDILKSSNQPAAKLHSHSCGHSYHCHSQADLTCGSFVHHRRCRRTRTVFSDAQMISLEKRFERQKYLSTSDRIELAEVLRLSQLQIKTWYQNRRMKWKKQVLQDGHQQVPTKPKGRPKKNSIPSYAELQRLENEKHMSVSTVSSSCTSDNEDATSSTPCSQDEEDFVDIEQ